MMSIRIMDKRNTYIIHLISLFLTFFFFLLTGCVRQDAWLSYAVPETLQPTPMTVYTPVPTRDPISLNVEPVQGEVFHTDRKGIPIFDKDTHYFTFYLSFSDMRIYEEDNYTYMDGICTNSFDGTLTGEANISFYDENEKIVGYGVIHTAEGNLTLSPGTNRIYAEILSEVNVQQLSCRVEQVSPFNPV